MNRPINIIINRDAPPADRSRSIRRSMWSVLGARWRDVASTSARAAAKCAYAGMVPEALAMTAQTMLALSCSRCCEWWANFNAAQTP